MNMKKVIFPCALVALMGLSSCNSMKFRHNFNNVTREDFVNKVNIIKGQQGTDPVALAKALNVKGHVTLSNSITYRQYVSGNMSFQYMEDYETDISWSEEDKYIKFDFYGKGVSSDDGSKWQESYTYYMVVKDNKCYALSSNNYVGTKYKYEIEYPESEEVRSYFVRASLMSGLAKDAGPYYYDYSPFLTNYDDSGLLPDWGAYFAPTLTGNEIIQAFSETGSGSIYERIDSYKKDTLKDTYGSNDDYSCMFNLAGSMEAINYANMMGSTFIKDLNETKGTVDLDLYCAFENNFLSQVEMKDSYDVTFNYKNNSIREVNDGYVRGSVTFGTCNVENVDLSRYVDVPTKK